MGEGFEEVHRWALVMIVYPGMEEIFASISELRLGLVKADYTSFVDQR